MTNYVLNEDKMFADITDGIAIIINSETGIYYGINAFGTCVYENLINGVSSGDVLKTLQTMPEIPQDFESNFWNFIKTLAEKEIIIKGSTQNREADFNYSIAKSDEFILKITEYNDAQELLLADPIHEVKEEEGWSPEKSALNEDKEDIQRREAKMEV